jgi:hypothetical protein
MSAHLASVAWNGDMATNIATIGTNPRMTRFNMVVPPCKIMD